ncbi:proton-conducting transporter transmembrane domain-containing protein [Flavihumibacter fluvii]|uniref:proton-conducting transporter transmembrane domain-containing protein n=1 Tax=Flavihumibacter fluvii TaxID=2838157 RepID=UPI001BDE7F1C|nr:proton-conducting transporter membrane subunit [Flavihumibacter fluvii]ULQ52314.1 hypothetical protein KJS93_19695 [Flavihumibacter fluvii]
MPQLLQLFIWLPFIGFITCMLVPGNKEKIISGITITTIVLHVFGCSLFIIYWLMNNHPILDSKHIVLYKSESFEFFIDFYFDQITAVFSFVGSFITLLVAIFSKYYMHRESGYKRFFATFILFFLAYNLIIFSGNFETLFVGWEVLGLCSFLLIAFYRDRYLPVKNGLKVISVYRLGDVCLMLAMWMCHHLFHENITFLKLNDFDFVSSHLTQHNSMFIFTAIMILIAAAAKSAMLPFSSWLPRAMEGPTTSSAVFYGSLSVHVGAFLLLRTYPFWQDITSVKILITLLGLSTSIIAAAIAKVQSTVKTQIAYSSITQIGLIFAEIALGFHTLAIIHFSGNALLRTYQLLVSPSVLSYQIHNMFFNFSPKDHTTGTGIWQKLKNTIYVISIKEWNLDLFQYKYLWMPFKLAGKQLKYFTGKVGIITLASFFLGGLYCLYIEEKIPTNIDYLLAIFFSMTALLLVLTAFSERGNAIKAWFSVIAAQCFITLSVGLNDFMEMHKVVIYLSGILVAAIIGFFCLLYIKRIDKDIALNRFHGYSYEKPTVAFIFLLCCLALLGFPFTPTFLGIDLLFTHIYKDQFILIITTSLSFIFIELAILRLYARIFLGQHKKNFHPIAYRSS